MSVFARGSAAQELDAPRGIAVDPTDGARYVREQHGGSLRVAGRVGGGQFVCGEARLF